MRESSTPSESWRIVLFTDYSPCVPAFLDFFNQRGHRLVGIVTSPKRTTGYLKIVEAAPGNTDVIVSNHPKRWAGMVQTLQPDLIVCFGFPWRIPSDVLALPRIGAVNEHPAPLPQYRGTDIPRWMLRHGEQTWGATVHWMTPEFDDGPILAQEFFEVGDDDDMQVILQRFDNIFPALWTTAFKRIAAHDPGDHQDESEATYFGNITDNEAWERIDWTSPAHSIHHQVRSCFGVMGGAGGLAVLEGSSVRILKTRLNQGSSGSNGASPGTILSRTDDGIIVQCGDGPITIVTYQPVDTERAVHESPALINSLVGVVHDVTLDDDG